jgi:DNA-binding transcriptional LysR family regulator
MLKKLTLKKKEGEGHMYDRGIEVFLSVASYHTSAGASQILNLTASAVSQRLRNLEDELNMIFIDRHS